MGRGVGKNINVVLSANSGDLRSQLRLAGQEVDRFGRKVDQTAKGVGTGGKLMGLAVKSGALIAAAGLAYSVKSAIDFDRAMRNVNSISKMSEGQFRKTGAAVLDLSTHSLQSATTLAEGLYDIASSGFQGSDGLLVLKASAAAASAGMSDTATAAKGITSVLNAYGLEASDAGMVSDVLFQTVNLGVITFGELAGVLGDVVGIGAAAKVNIGELGSAIAAMTLAGISGAESGTSLNRVIQSIIAPGDALSATLQQLGYESGAQALQVDGLHGVMEKLRKVTGGNVEQLLTLFPEIRAARGAFALMANEGKNYNKTFGEIGNTNKVAGATQAALAEQMKSAGAQFTLFKNQVQAGAIEIGQKLLPGLVGLGQALMDLAQGGAKVLGQAIHALTPFFTSLYNAGIDVVDILGEMLDVLGPLATAIAAIAFGAVAATLTVLGAGLESVTGFLKDHEEIVTAVAVAYGLWKAQIAGTAGLKLAGTLIDGLKNHLSDLAEFTGQAGGKWAAFRSIISNNVIGLAALTLVIAGTAQAMHDINARADEKVSGLGKGLDPKSFDDLDVHLGRLNRTLHATGDGYSDNTKQLAGYDTVLQGISFGAINLGAADTVAETNKLADALESVSKKRLNIATNVLDIARDANIHGPGAAKAIRDMASALNVDLTGAENGPKAKAARQAVLKHIDDLTIKTGLSTQQLAKQTGNDVGQMEALAKSIEKVGKAASTNFTKSFDVIKTLGEAADKTTGKVADAPKVIGDFYKESVTKATAFYENLKTAAARGLDPAELQKLITAGPAAAGPAVEAMVNDSSGNLIKIVNQGEAALREINQKVVELSRLTQQAISGTSAKAADLGLAMQISAENMAQGADATLTTVAAKIGKPSAEVQRVAEEYGITLVEAAQKGIDGHPLNIQAKGAQNALVKTLGAAGLSNSQIQVVLDLAIKGDKAGLEKTVKDLDLAKGEKKAILTAVGVEQAQEKVANYVAKLNLTDDQRSTIVGVVGTPTAVADIEALAAKFHLTERQVITLLKADGSPAAQQEVELLRAKAKSIDGQTSTVHINADDQASGPLSRAASLLAGIRANPNAHITISQTLIAAGGDPRAAYTGTHSANGNIFYANGGENHSAQIAPGGVRIWAEPETGGEAYIPLAQSKRGRSQMILADVARQFGMALVPAGATRMAMGGMVERYGSQGAGGPLVQTTLVVQGNIYGEDHLHRQIKTSLDTRDADLSRRLRGRR